MFKHRKSSDSMKSKQLSRVDSYNQLGHNVTSPLTLFNAFNDDCNKRNALMSEHIKSQVADDSILKNVNIDRLISMCQQPNRVSSKNFIPVSNIFEQQSDLNLSMINPQSNRNCTMGPHKSICIKKVARVEPEKEENAFNIYYQKVLDAFQPIEVDIFVEASI